MSTSTPVVWPDGPVVVARQLRDQRRIETGSHLFADHGFAGVEVQPFNVALPPLSQSEKEKVNSWDTPAYYENLRTVLDEARRRGLLVDVTNGSGWPPSAPSLQTEDGFLSLEFSNTTVAGGNPLSFSLPARASNKNRTRAIPQLQALVTARLLPTAAGDNSTVPLEVV